MLSVDTHNHLKKYGKGISLLLVDDDVISLELYRNLLLEYFPSVDIATDGIEAFEKWSKKPVFLIILRTNKSYQSVYVCKQSLNCHLKISKSNIWPR